MATFWLKKLLIRLTIFSLFIMSICNPIRGRDFGSDCVSSRSLLTFSFFTVYEYIIQKIDVYHFGLMTFDRL